MFDFDLLDEEDTGGLTGATLPQLRVWAVSDVHSDYKANLEWVQSFRKHADSYEKDCLIVAGDVTHRLDLLRDTLCSFKEVFQYVFFTPGNHDLWRYKNDCVDSLDKLRQILALCDEIGVLTCPTELPLGSDGKTLLIVPMLSWHHQAFDTEPELSGSWTGVIPAETVFSDYTMCTWPPGLSQLDDTVAERLDAETDKLWSRTVLRQGCLSKAERESYTAVISFSHFLPRIELCPEKRFLSVPSLLKAVGSVYLGKRVARLRPDIHVFGHTHFGWDMELNGTRFVQAPLSYVNERKHRMMTISVGDFVPGTEEGAPRPFLVWCGNTDQTNTRGACWSSFYKHYGRRPEQVRVLPNFVAMGLKWQGRGEQPSGWCGQAPASAFVDDAEILRDFVDANRRDAAKDNLERIGGPFRELAAQELWQRLQLKDATPQLLDVTLLDVRPAEKFRLEHALDAISLPLADIHRLSLLLPRSRRLGIFERITDPKALKVVYGKDKKEALAGVQLIRKLCSERTTSFAYVCDGFAACKSAGLSTAPGLEDGLEPATGHLE
eukprot:TRINITY_DN29351_c0_g1_i1.p1 TRINITY_DN29351_c0_g1~~TRINITY_DN29351_c0_g1_i1.p1  ORF type:complete len:550 (-),score=88.16 TRINITY_DN29351_c0_g1_i1:22-1671(-)